MRSQLSYAVTVSRCTFAIAGLALGTTMLRDPSIAGQQRMAGVAFLLLGVSLVALELYLRLSTKTLVIANGMVDVRQRGISLGSVPTAAVRYFDLSSRVRILVRSLLLPLLGFVFGVVVSYSGDQRLGAILLAVAVLSTAASLYDFRLLWEVALPKPGTRDTVVGLQRPDDSRPLLLTVPGPQRVLLLRKPDVIKLIGFWPPDARQHRRNATSA